MERCFKCERTADDVKLLDAVNEQEIVKICEECALIEDIPIIRMPSTSQLKSSEKAYSVKERLKRMAGLHGKEKKEIAELAKKMTNITLDDLRKIRKSKEERIKEELELARQKNKPLELTENYHWSILMARKKKKLTRKQVAELLGESESAIKMIENKQFPEDALRLIMKLEQYFGLKLRKKTEEETKEDKKEIMVEVPEEPKAVEVVESKKTENEPAVILRLDRENMQNLTIADLKKMKEQKEEAEKLKEKAERERLEKAKNNANNLIFQVEKEEKKKEKESWEKAVSESMIGEDIEIAEN